MRPDRFGVSVGEIVERITPFQLCARLRSRAAYLRIQRAARDTGGEMERLSLGAEASAICWMVGIAAHARDNAGFGIDQDTAADAAVAAD
jgi:hypothetical protein